MSFNDLERTATNTSNRYSDYPQFDTLCKSIESQLGQINRTLPQLREKYDPDQHNSTTEAFKRVNDKVKELNSYISRVQSEHEDIEIVNYFRQKEAILVKLTKDSLGRFQTLQQQQSETAQQQHETAQQQTQVQIDYEPVNAEELEQQTLLIQEREREIHRIQQDTQEINDIFANLSSIVNEQQFQIDSIENNIFNYSSNAAAASSELRRAERYQRRSGGRMLCCLVILLGVLGFVVLVGVIF